MYIWVLVSLILVVGVKYFTSREMANLERRLHAVKDALQEKKLEYDAEKSNQNEVQSRETAMEERIKHMKEIIHDLNIRLTQGDEPREDVSMTL